MAYIVYNITKLFAYVFQVSSVISENGGFAAQLPPIKAQPSLSPSNPSKQMLVIQNRGMYHQSQPRISTNEG